MTDGNGKGFLLSATLHGSIAIALFLFGVVWKNGDDDLPKVEPLPTLMASCQ